MDDNEATNLPDNDQHAADAGAGVANLNEHDDGANESGDGQPQDGQATNQDDDSEEVEHEGQKYRIPKALKSALMMNADYTRKTQEVAEQRPAQRATSREEETPEQRRARIEELRRRRPELFA